MRQEASASLPLKQQTKKQIMKRKKLLLATLLIPAMCHAQSVVEYAYDDAGNRVSQEDLVVTLWEAKSVHG